MKVCFVNYELSICWFNCFFFANENFISFFLADDLLTTESSTIKYGLVDPEPNGNFNLPDDEDEIFTAGQSVDPYMQSCVNIPVADNVLLSCCCLKI